MRLMYVAAVEVETKREVDTEAAMKLLADYSPSFGTSSRGWVEVQLRLSATGLAHACTKASALARAATGAEAIACQVMTAQEHRARFGGSASEPIGHGRHGSSGDTVWLPRQATEPWERADPPQGRHSG